MWAGVVWVVCSKSENHMAKQNTENDFTQKTKDTLAKRAGQQCSMCRRRTSGPHTNEDSSINIGEAAHIKGARLGSARYDVSMTPDERSAITNGIWLCRSCAALIDRDEGKYTVTSLIDLKEQHEHRIHTEINTDLTPLIIQPPAPIGTRFEKDFSANHPRFDRVYTPRIIDTPRADIEYFLRKPANESYVSAGSRVAPQGGIECIYNLTNYSLYIVYDSGNIAREVSLTGIDHLDYTIEYEWREAVVFAGFSGIYDPPISNPPGMKPINVQWKNYQGYRITVIANKIGGIITEVRVSKA